jgi:hypothetical protein
MSKSLWSCALACALLAGCAAMHPRVEKPAQMQSCDSGRACVIAVDVQCTQFYGCELSVDYDLVLVEDPGKPTNIVWRLTGEPQARFATNGIVVDSSDFRCAGRPETREFMCVDEHTGFGVFKYRVNVTVPQSPFGPRGVPSLDPWIVNR